MFELPVYCLREITDCVCDRGHCFAGVLLQPVQLQLQHFDQSTIPLRPFRFLAEPSTFLMGTMLQLLLLQMGHRLTATEQRCWYG